MALINTNPQITYQPERIKQKTGPKAKLFDPMTISGQIERTLQVKVDIIAQKQGVSFSECLRTALEEFEAKYRSH